MRHAVINVATGLVENIAEIVDGDGSTVEAGYLLFSGDANIGDGWNGTSIVPQPRPEPEPRPVMTPADKRKLAYQAESDALVIRAMRLQLAGDPGFEAAKKEALAKVAEIKVRHPDKAA